MSLTAEEKLNVLLETGEYEFIKEKLTRDELWKLMFLAYSCMNEECEVDESHSKSSAEPKKGHLVNPTPYGECSECGFLIDSREGYNFCPNCGTDIREG